MGVLYSVIGLIVFLCIFWGVWASHYFLSTYNLTGVAEILPSDMAYVLFAVAIPVILLLMIVLVVYLAFVNSRNKNVLMYLLKVSNSQMMSFNKLVKEFSDSRKLNLSNQFFSTLPLVFDDMSQIIADIIYKTGMDSKVVIDDALAKNGTNRLYSVCKIILDKRESTPRFDESLKRMVMKSESLAGMILLFSEKYDKFLKVLLDYDLEHFVSNIIEEGELGKVRGILLLALNSLDDTSKSFEKVEKIEEKEENISFLDDSLEIYPSEK